LSTTCSKDGGQLKKRVERLWKEVLSSRTRVRFARDTKVTLECASLS